MNMLMNMLIFFNFVTFLYILIGVDINYKHAKNAYIFFFSVFILMICTIIVPMNLTWLTNLLGLLSIIAIICLYVILKKNSDFTKTNQGMFLLFFVTQSLYILLDLFS